MNEDEIVIAVVGAVERSLANANSSRTFAVQTALPTAPSSSSKAETSGRSAAAPNYKVRIDPANRTLHSMIAVVNPSQLSKTGPGGEPQVDTANAASWAAPLKSDDLGSETDCDLTSIRELRQAVLDNQSSELTELLAKHVYVGLVDQQSCLALVQHGTRLQLVNYAALG